MKSSRQTTVQCIAVILALITLLSCCSVGAFAAKKTPDAAYSAVKKAYGSSMPLSAKNRITGKKRIMGVKTADCESYFAALKIKGGKNAQSEYAIFICKAKSKAKVKTIVANLKTYLKNEQQSMNNYLSPTGKKLFKNAKVGTVGQFVYLVMLDTAANKKAVNAINKTLK